MNEMYYLKLNQTEYEQFKKLAKVKMIEKDMSVDELADLTGFSKQAIYNFFCKTNSKFIAYAISEILMKGEEK